MAVTHRATFEGDQLLLPELLHLGHHVSRHARPSELPKHEHPIATEICYLHRGVVDWWVEDTVHHLTPGRVFITMPGEPHGGVDDALHACELYWLQLRLTPGRALPGLPRSAGHQFTDDLRTRLPRTFEASPVVHEAFGELHREHVRRRPHGAVRARAALHRLLAVLLEDATSSTASRGVSTEIEAVQAWLRKGGPDVPAVAEMAARAGMSVTHFHRRFAEEVGLTPGQWVTRQHIARARTRLASTDESITRIAMDAGFNSSQAFATCFRRLTGMTPTAYRNRSR